MENLATPSGNVVVAAIPARPRGQVFHTRDGKYLIRVGEDLRGLTLAKLDDIRQETVSELTAQPMAGDWKSRIRPAGMEDLRALMAEARAEPDLLKLGDEDLLRALGVLTIDGTLLAAGLLLVGRSEEIQRRFPNAHWSFFRMQSDTDYHQAERGHDCFAVALRRLRELVNTDNPILTIKGDLVHAEIPRYPHLAVRELLVNALVHRDYAVPGGVTLKLYPDRMELSNPGGFLGGITPENILHHASAPRYTTLFGALARIRVANAANLGVPRVFRDLLSEGKEPPCYHSAGQSVTVTVFGHRMRALSSSSWWTPIPASPWTACSSFIIWPATAKSAPARPPIFASARSPLPVNSSPGSRPASAFWKPAARRVAAATTGCLWLHTLSLAIPLPTMWTAGWLRRT